MWPEMSGELSAAAERLAELRSAADDMSEVVRDLRDAFDFEAGEPDEIESRLDVLYRLKKKYGGTVGEMLAYLEQCRRERAEIEYSSETIAKLEKQKAALLSKAREHGEKLSAARKKAANSPAGAHPVRTAAAGYAESPLSDGVPAQGRRTGHG